MPKKNRRGFSSAEVLEITDDAATEFGRRPEQDQAFYTIVSAGALTTTEAKGQLWAANRLADGGVSLDEAVHTITKAAALTRMSMGLPGDFVLEVARSGTGRWYIALAPYVYDLLNLTATDGPAAMVEACGVVAKLAREAGDEWGMLAALEAKVSPGSLV